MSIKLKSIKVSIHILSKKKPSNFNKSGKLIHNKLAKYLQMEKIKNKQSIKIVKLESLILSKSKNLKIKNRVFQNFLKASSKIKMI